MLGKIACQVTLLSFVAASSGLSWENEWRWRDKNGAYNYDLDSNGPNTTRLKSLEAEMTGKWSVKSLDPEFKFERSFSVSALPNCGVLIGVHDHADVSEKSPWGFYIAWPSGHTNMVLGAYHEGNILSIISARNPGGKEWNTTVFGEGVGYPAKLSKLDSTSEIDVMPTQVSINLMPKGREWFRDPAQGKVAGNVFEYDLASNKYKAWCYNVDKTRGSSGSGLIFPNPNPEVKSAAPYLPWSDYSGETVTRRDLKLDLELVKDGGELKFLLTNVNEGVSVEISQDR